jgi:glycine hydroxymethyltransferase
MTESPGTSTGEPYAGYFSTGLSEADPEISQAIHNELTRQRDQVELIASENLVSKAVLEAQGSILTNKTVEGYPGRRYYGGAEYVDRIERLAIERARRLFGCAYANVQPHSGSQANQAVYLALLKPGDKILGMALSAGGHLSHGAVPNLSGRWFDVARYGVRRQDGLIDYDDVAEQAAQHTPRLIIAGGSAYPRTIDFARFRAIADSIGGMLMVDMAHFAGLVAAGCHPDPLPHADVVTTTTYKSLRGVRGGLILTNNADIARKVNAAIFPGLQGTPLLHTVAAKAVCLGEALRPEFRQYCERAVENARVLARTLLNHGFEVVSGGTDTALMLVDLRAKGLTGDVASQSLERAGLTCNKNTVPFDTEKPTVTSGLRLSSSVGTTRGFGVEEFQLIGELIVTVLDGLAVGPSDNAETEHSVIEQVADLCARFPIYPTL